MKQTRFNAKNIIDSAWSSDETGDMMVVEKNGGEFSAVGSKFDIQGKTATELVKKLKNYGYEHIGYN